MESATGRRDRVLQFGLQQKSFNLSEDSIFEVFFEIAIVEF
jgi:hypothetical protein